MGINKRIIQVKADLISILNESKLPPTVVDMIIGDVKNYTERMVSLAIEAENKAEEGEKEDGEEIHKN